MYLLFILFCLTATVVSSAQLRGSYECNKRKLITIAQTIKSPNTMHHVVSVISLKTSIPPHAVAECLGFYWNKNSDRNKWTMDVSTLR